MKRTFAQGKTLIALFVLLSGLFLSANRAEAQQSLNGNNGNTTVAFKPAQEVLLIAIAQVEFWHQQGPFSPGTSAANNQTRHAAYFKAIHAAVSEGTSVGNAITQSLSAAATVGGEQEASFTSKTVLNAIKEEAIELFK